MKKENSIFKDYDIRGKYPNEINPKLFYKIGLIVGKKFKKIVVGRDCRLSSPILSSSFLKGLTDSGAQITDINIVTSPMLSLFCVIHKIRGAMVTASHNPKEYNGIKFIDTNGQQLSYDLFLKKIEKEIWKVKINRKVGKIKHTNFLEKYTIYLKKNFNVKKINQKKIVIDCSNGVSGIPLLKLKQKRFKAILINKNPNGNFPNHGPDQTKTGNLRQLQKAVIKNKADLGIIIDGDGDRCSFVDEKGKTIPQSIAFLILALYELKKSNLKNPKILIDLTFSKVVSETLSKTKAKSVKMRVGNPYYKKIFHEDKNALIGGEYSGHIMYKENHGIDDAIYASLKMISALLELNESLSEIVTIYRKYYNTGQISIKTSSSNLILKKIYAKFSKYKIKKIDGISVDMKDVWFNIRASNTEPVIRFIIEGKTKKDVEKVKKKIIRIIKDNQ